MAFRCGWLVIEVPRSISCPRRAMCASMLCDGCVATAIVMNWRAVIPNKKKVCFCAWAEMQCDTTLIHGISILDNGRSDVAWPKITIPHVARLAVFTTTRVLSRTFQTVLHSDSIEKLVPLTHYISTCPLNTKPWGVGLASATDKPSYNSTPKKSLLSTVG